MVDVASSTTNWTAITYGSNLPDPSNDQQTGSGEGDIVGNLSHPSSYAAFGDAGTPSKTDGTLGFRIRLGADSNPPGFDGAIFVGIDANRDGALDIFIGVNNSGSSALLGMWNPGAGSNTSPSTTTIGNTALVLYIQTASNINFSPVSLSIDPTVGTATDLNADGKNDYFLTFSVPFADIVAQLAARGITGFDQTTALNYVIATSTQGNSLIQDLNGVAKNYDSNATWGTLGAQSNATSADIIAVPELSTTVLLLSAAPFCFGMVQTRRRRFAPAGA